MLPPNAGAALQAALPQVLAGLPATAVVRVFRALPGLAAALPPGLRLSFAQGMKPLHDALRAEGRGPVDDGLAEPAGLPAPSLALLLLPRSREEGRALLARAVCGLAPGGLVLAAALNEEGAKAFEKDLAALMPLGGGLSKAHGRAFWTQPRPAMLEAATQVLAQRWIAADVPRHDPHTGLWTRPGVFNEGRLDAGSALLIAHLPASLRGRVADLGAGSGLLARAVLERCPGVTMLDLFEAEARALELARRHLAGARVPVGFHWHDVAGGVPGRFDAIVCNPPFHVGSRGVPALGRAFIAAAARALTREGQLLLVANRHLPYEEALREAFAHGELVAGEGGFKVYRAWGPRL
ncbi:MAG: 16S rRNA methyltransferase [Silanimonas sp.]|nr:MAG: 16S rRNA methyltransferase [Silanimonas sp.]